MAQGPCGLIDFSSEYMPQAGHTLNISWPQLYLTQPWFATGELTRLNLSLADHLFQESDQVRRPRFKGGQC